MSAATQQTSPAKRRGLIKIPDLRVAPKYKEWTELRLKKRLAHYRDDVSAVTIERDRARLKRAAETHAAACSKNSNLSFVDPTGPNLDPDHIARERERWTKLIYDEAVCVDRASRDHRTRIYWFAATVVNPDYFVQTDEITPARVTSLRRRHARCFSNLTGGMFEAGWIDISLNTEVDGARYWSLHVHSLIGVKAGNEADAKRKLKSAYANGTSDPRVKKPAQFRRTYLTAPPKKRRHVIGWLAYCFKSARPGGIARGGKWTSETGEIKKAKGPLQPGQLAEILPRLAKITFADRRVICGARYAHGRLTTNAATSPGMTGRADFSSLPKNQNLAQAQAQAMPKSIKDTKSKQSDLEARFDVFADKLVRETTELYEDGVDVEQLICALAAGVARFAVDAKVKPEELDQYLAVISVLPKSRFRVRVEKRSKKKASAPRAPAP